MFLALIGGSGCGKQAEMLSVGGFCGTATSEPLGLDCRFSAKRR